MVNDLRVCERLASLEAAAWQRRPAEIRCRHFLGVKWSQVQILSARPGKAVLTCCSRSPKPNHGSATLCLGPRLRLRGVLRPHLSDGQVSRGFRLPYCHQDDVPIASKSLLSLLRSGVGAIGTLSKPWRVATAKCLWMRALARAASRV